MTGKAQNCVLPSGRRKLQTAIRLRMVEEGAGCAVSASWAIVDELHWPRQSDQHPARAMRRTATVTEIQRKTRITGTLMRKLRRRPERKKKAIGTSLKKLAQRRMKRSSSQPKKRPTPTRTRGASSFLAKESWKMSILAKFSPPSMQS